MLPSHNPNSLFNQTKDWIDRGQAEVKRQHDIRAELGQTPLSILIEDIKQDPQKHIQSLKRMMATAAVVATGMSSFNPNAVAQSQNLTQIETNTTQLQSNSEKSIQTNYQEEATAKAETKIVQQFVNQVFNTQSEYSSMQSGGTPKAIKHALENGGTITTQNAPQIIMEAIKTNNGATNPINLKHYKQQIKMFNLNIEAGYTPTQALIKSQADSAKLNPTQIKAPRIDLERLNNMVSKIGEECTDVNIDSLQGISDVQKAFIKTEVKKPDSLIKKPIPAQKPIDLLKLLESQGKLPNVAPSISPSPTILTSQDSKNGNASKENTKNPINGPFNNPSNPTVPPEAKVEITPDKGFEWFQTMNQKAIQDTLMQLGIIFAVGGVATFAGIKATKALYNKYQAWESTLPNLSNDEARRNFWENVDNMKRDYKEKKVKKQNFDAKYQGVVVDKLIKNATEEGDMQEFDQIIGNNPVNFNSTDVKQININLLENRPKVVVENLPQPTPQSTELKPKLGERWSSFIAVFRQKFTNVTTKFSQPFKQAAENKRLLDQTKAREQSVVEDMARYSLNKEHKKAGNVSKLVYNLRSMYNHLLLDTKPWFEDNRDEAEEYIREQERNEAKTPEPAPSKPRSRIPDIDYENLPKIEDFLDPEEKRSFSNNDIKAYLLIAEREYEIFREKSVYRAPALKGLEYYKENTKKINWEKLVKKLVKDNRLDKNPLFISNPLTVNSLKIIPEGVHGLSSSITRHPQELNKEIYNPHNYSSHNIFKILSFERYLIILRCLSKHFANDKGLSDALEVIMDFTQAQENELVAQNTMNIELERRQRLIHNFENVGGKCEELDKQFHESLNKVFRSYLNLEKGNMKTLCLAMYEKLEHFTFLTNGNKIIYHTLDKVDFTKMKEFVVQIEEITKKKRIKINPNYDNYVGISELQEVKRLINLIQARLKYPANSIKYTPDIFETDIMPDLKTQPLDAVSYLRNSKDDPASLIIQEDGKNVIKYPSSAKFPELLERIGEAKHIEYVARYTGLINGISALKYSRDKLDFLIKPEWIIELQTLITKLQDPTYAYRPYRKKKSETTEESLKQLFLDYASIDVDPT